MSYIIRTGNIAKTPELQEGPKSKYTRVLVLVNDSEQNDQGEWEETATIAYNVTVFGNQAENLVKTAEQSGNIRVTFGGRYRAKEYENKEGQTVIGHDVRADFIGASFQGQTAAVERTGRAAADNDE